MTPEAQALLALAVFVGFLVEATVGFGSTLLSVALGALILPLEAFLPAVVLLNLPLSGWILARDHAAVDRALLLRVAPLMALGMPLGLALGGASPEVVGRALGALVLGLAGFELLRPSAAGPLGRGRAAVCLLGGGVAHGLCGSGGPLAVYVAGRQLACKRAFRATLAALWVALNLLLLAGLLARGALEARHLAPCLPLAPALVLGLLAGERLHARVEQAAFRRLVYGLLTLAGLVLLVRG